MPSPAVYPLRLLQVGKETTPGTPVPATWQLVGESVLTPLITRYFSEYPRGVITPVTGGGTPLLQGVNLITNTDLSYEELIYPLNLGLATGVITGAGADKTHTFTPVLTGNPGIQTATAEYAMSDGTATAFPFPGATGFPLTAQSAYLFSTGFDITWAFNAIATAQYRYSGRAAAFAPAAVPTPALTVMTGRERIPSNLVRLSMDPTWAGLGTTTLTGVVRSGKLTFVSGIEPDYTTDGRAALDFTQLRWGMDRFFTLQLVLEMDATSAAEIKAWVAQNAGGGAISPNAAAGGNVALRFLRFEVTSPNVLGASARRIRIDNSMIYTKEPVFTQQGRAEIVTMELKSEYDPVSARSFAAAIVNSLPTFT